MAYKDKVAPTKDGFQELWDSQQDPTIEQVMRCYRIIAQTERMKTGRPGTETVANVLLGARSVCRAAGVPLSAPTTALTRRKIDLALASFMERGLARLSALSNVCQLRAMFARWCRPYYEDARWEIPPLEIPTFRAQTYTPVFCDRVF